MARIRSIKPEFWTDEDLSDLPPETHLLAVALLNHADDEGYFRAHPKLVEASCCPLREDSVSVHDMLNQLASIGYITLGTGDDGKRYGHIRTFEKHQRVNRPSPSQISDLSITWDSEKESLNAHGEFTEDSSPELGAGSGEQGAGSGEPGMGRADPPSQPEPPESKQADQLPAAPEAAGEPSPKSSDDKHQGDPANRETWEAYAAEYQRRYGVEPIRNAKVNTQIANFVKRVGKENAPHVAAFYVRHNGQFYVGRGHQVGIMLNDAEKLYTEWASGQKVTAKAARDADRLEEAGQGWEALKQEDRHG